MTPFRAILKRAVDATPNAVGSSFADSEGEMVDAYTPAYDQHDWAVLTAHYGVLLGHVESLFGTWHYGGPEYFIAHHAKLDVIVHTVEHGYFTLLATQRSGDDEIDTSLTHVRAAVLELKKEMA